MQYWTHLFTWQTWQEFLQAGGEVVGFPERRWKTVQQMQAGDVLLAYLVGVSRYIAVLRVAGDPFHGYRPIWSERLFPARVPCNIEFELLPGYGVPVTELRSELSYFQNLSYPHAWTGHFRQTPISESSEDAEIIMAAIEDACDDPIFRPYNPRDLERRITNRPAPPGLPPTDELAEDEPDSTHEEIQWLLLNLGSQMGLDVWVATNDKGRAFEGRAFREIPRLLSSLPRQFDEETHRTIEMIDVLWLRGNAIVAAFEVEHTSAIYSGLLRMADLVAMQPNLHIRLFIVAPDERREKVYKEIQRPAFSHLSPPLTDVCSYIPYSALKEKIEAAQDLLPYLKPDFLDNIAERFIASQR